MKRVVSKICMGDMISKFMNYSPTHTSQRMKPLILCYCSKISSIKTPYHT
jgi:hypothetical protein